MFAYVWIWLSTKCWIESQSLEYYNRKKNFIIIIFFSKWNCIRREYYFILKLKRVSFFLVFIWAIYLGLNCRVRIR